MGMYFYLLIKMLMLYFCVLMSWKRFCLATIGAVRFLVCAASVACTFLYFRRKKKMKNIKKLFALLLIITLCMLWAVACESDKPNETSDQNSNITDTTTPESVDTSNTTTEVLHEHAPITDIAVAATCTTAGKTAGTHCFVCGEVIVAQTEIPALGHTEVIDAAVEPTCGKNGKTEGSHCSVCNTVLKKQTEIPTAIPHTVVIDAAVEGTCSKNGKTEGSHCSVCNTVIKPQTTTSAKPHTEVIDSGIDATCVSDGKTEGKHCSVCGAVTVTPTSIPAKGHTEVIDNAVPASCTGSGKSEGKHCSVCSTIIVAQNNIAATGHKYDNNCDTTCNTCGQKRSVGAHLYGTNGKCTYCDAKNPDANYSLGLEFILSDDGKSYIVAGIGTCTDSDIIIPSTYMNLPVTIIGKYAFRGCTTLNSISIPNSITTVYRNSFDDCTSLQKNKYNNAYYIGNENNPYLILIEAASDNISSCNINSNTKIIAGYVFAEIESLKSVNIPYGVTHIGDLAFEDCESLNSISIPNSVISIGEEAFRACTSFTNITIPASVISIGENAFSACSSLTSITIEVGNKIYHSSGNCLIETATKTLITGCQKSIIPSDGSVTCIAKDSFYRCTSLKKITIPACITKIEKGAFSRCDSLEIITIAPGNSIYHSQGNCIIETASKTIIAGCNYSVIPTDGTVTCIGDEAFAYCFSITSINLPGSITSIGNYAFAYCNSLTSITIPNSVKNINPNAFGWSPPFKSLNFTGTIAEWKALSHDKSWSFIVICTDGKLDSDGNIIG